MSYLTFSRMAEKSQGKTVALINAVSAVVVATITTLGGTIFIANSNMDESLERATEKVTALEKQNKELSDQNQKLEQENTRLKEKTSESSAQTPTQLGPIDEPEQVGNIRLVWPEKDVYEPQEKITIRYQNLPGNTKDWIAVAKVGDSIKSYRQYFYTEGSQEGVFVFDGLNSGNYEVRVFLNFSEEGYIPPEDKYLFSVRAN